MLNKRLLAFMISFTLAIAVYFFFVDRYGHLLGSGESYILNAVLALYFFAMLVSHQQFEEDLLLKLERIVSVFLFSFVFFFQLIYAPLANYFFKTLIARPFFLSDVLALLFLMLFLLLFVVTLISLNSFARFGLLSNWVIFNNEAAFFALRTLWFTGVTLAIYLYLRSPFIIIS
jgi:hypothetical protein